MTYTLNSLVKSSTMNRNNYYLCALLVGIYLIISKSEASSRNHASRIIGGEEVRAGQFPFAAAVQVQTADSRFFCGGALTGNDWVITAGHCVYNAVLFTIQLGSIHLDSDDPGRMTVVTSTYILHPDFKPDTIENDIGLIKFRRPIDYNVYLSGIFGAGFEVADSYLVYSLGWGTTSDSEDQLSNALRFAEVTTLSNAECRIYYGNQITDNMLCAIGNFNEGTCIGDNGGPLVARYGKYLSLVGVASFVSANGCESNYPSGYTRIYPYDAWIRNITNE